MDKIEFVPDDRLKEDISEEKPEIVPKDAERIITEEQAVDKSVKNIYTLPYLKKKYGRLSRIRTKDGREYTGAFRQLGKSVEIISTKGKFRIPASKIEKVSPY